MALFVWFIQLMRKLIKIVDSKMVQRIGIDKTKIDAFFYATAVSIFKVITGGKINYVLKQREREIERKIHQQQQRFCVCALCSVNTVDCGIKTLITISYDLDYWSCNWFSHKNPTVFRCKTTNNTRDLTCRKYTTIECRWEFKPNPSYL